MTAGLEEMGWNVLFVRFFAFVLFIPVTSAAVAYWQRRFAPSMIWNGNVPLLCASVLKMFFNQTRITAGGLLTAKNRDFTH
jgi:hypothetical protein